MRNLWFQGMRGKQIKVPKAFLRRLIVIEINFDAEESAIQTQDG